jgi:hypothetical protein
MLPARFDDIGSDDILRLIEDEVEERKRLEYKQALNLINTEDRAEFLADISSFANASGGDIIFGISDRRNGGNATGIPDAIVPLSLTNLEMEKGRMSQLIETGVQPRISGIQLRVIEIPEKGPVIIVRVPKSWIGPHMVNYANRTRFFSRNNILGKFQLDVQQIGDAFLQRRGVGERMLSWKSDRIGKAIAGEGPVPLQGPLVLFHFVSAAALTDGEQSLPRIFDTQLLLSNCRLFSLTAQTTRYNADGLLLLSNPTKNQRQSYLQIFRDGSLEYGDSAALDSWGGGHVPSQAFERNIATAFKGAVGLLKELEVPEPTFASLTLVGMKGRTMALPDDPFGWRTTTDPFDRDVILSPDMRIENLAEGFPYPTTLLPIVNAVWQAAGRDQTPYLNGGGVWKQQAN